MGSQTPLDGSAPPVGTGNLGQPRLLDLLGPGPWGALIQLVG